MFQKTITDMLENIWPMLLIIAVIIISTRIAYIICNEKKISIHKELLSLIFIMYILCLFHLVTFQDVSIGGSNFIPFKEISRYKLFSKLFFRNIFGNILLFIPYGFFTTYFLKTKKIKYPLLLTIIISVTIEIVQYNIGRVFDIDDIILNIIGGIIGYFVFIGADAIRNKLPNVFKKDGFMNAVIIIIMLLLFLYFFI